MFESRKARLTIACAVALGTLSLSQGLYAQQGSWTKDKSPLTITWFVDQDWYQKKWDGEKDLLDKKITTDTGITVDIVSGNSDKLSVLIASGNLPDVVTTWVGSPQRAVMEKGGVLLPFNDLVSKYAPDFNVPKSMQDWYRNADGNYYGYVNYFYAKERMAKGNFYVTHNRFSIRQDIADKLGIKVADFSTKDGAIAALLKVKAAAPTYNDLKVIPFYPANASLNQSVEYMAQMFGAVAEDSNGQYADWRKSPAALESLKFYNELFNKGLMPTDAITMSREQIGGKVANGAVFMLQGIQVESYMKTLQGSDAKAVYSLVGPIKGAEGKITALSTSGLTGWTISMITKNAKHPERIIRFMDYMAQPETVLDCQWGPLGAAWEMVDGHVRQFPTVTAEYKADWTMANQKYGDGTFPWFVDWLPIQRTFPLPQTDIEKSNAAYERDVYGPYVKDDTSFSDLVPESSDDVGIAAKLDQYWTRQVAKMIVAKPAQVESIYKESIAQMDALGWASWQKAVNTVFQKNKARLGLKLAYPKN